MTLPPVDARRASVVVEGIVRDPGRPTTEKVRIVTERNQQVARVDYERDVDVHGAVEDTIVDRLRRLGAAAKPLIVDPKIPHLSCYVGATLITPNHHEAEIATHRRIRTDEDARDAAEDFRG